MVGGKKLKKIKREKNWPILGHMSFMSHIRIPDDFLVEEAFDNFSEDPDPLLLSKDINVRKASRDVGRFSTYENMYLALKKVLSVP